MQIVLLCISLVGVAVVFVGCLAAVITTFGISKRWGIASLLVPILPIVCCVLHWRQARYALGLLALGIGIAAAAVAGGSYAGCSVAQFFFCG